MKNESSFKSNNSGYVDGNHVVETPSTEKTHLPTSFSNREKIDELKKLRLQRAHQRGNSKGLDYSRRGGRIVNDDTDSQDEHELDENPFFFYSSASSDSDPGSQIDSDEENDKEEQNIIPTPDSHGTYGVQKPAHSDPDSFEKVDTTIESPLDESFFKECTKQSPVLDQESNNTNNGILTDDELSLEYSPVADPIPAHTLSPIRNEDEGSDFDEFDEMNNSDNSPKDSKFTNETESKLPTEAESLRLVESHNELENKPIDVVQEKPIHHPHPVSPHTEHLDSFANTNTSDRGMKPSNPENDSHHINPVDSKENSVPTEKAEGLSTPSFPIDSNRSSSVVPLRRTLRLPTLASPNHQSSSFSSVTHQLSPPLQRRETFIIESDDEDEDKKNLKRKSNNEDTKDIRMAKKQVVSPRVPITSSDSNIIVLTDEEDENDSSLIETKTEQAAFNPQSVKAEPAEAKTSSKMEDHKPTLLDAQQHYVQLTKNLETEERELRLTSESLQATNAILHKKLIKREEDVSRAHSKLLLFQTSMQNRQPTSTQKILAEEAQRNLTKAKQKKIITEKKLTALLIKLNDHQSHYENFMRDRDTKINQAKNELILIERDTQAKEVVEKRNKLIQEQDRLHAMLKEGDLTLETHHKLVQDIKRQLDMLSAQNLPKPGVQDPALQNRSPPFTEKEPDLFENSIKTAKDLLAKNTTRTEMTKRMLYGHLDRLLKYKQNFEHGRNCPQFMMNECRDSAELLFSNGVKMPVVFETLEDYGITFRDRSILKIHKRDQFFKTLEVAKDLFSKSSRSSDVKSAVVKILDYFAILRKDIDVGIPPSYEEKIKASQAVLLLKKHGLKMEKLYENLKRYKIATTPEEFAVLKQSLVPNTNFNTFDSYRDQHKMKWQLNKNVHNSMHHVPSPSPNSSSIFDETGLANIHNISDQEHIRELLMNVKQTESETEGEVLTPEQMTVNLLKHQRIGLKWLLNVESSKKKGGLLADDMGLGKTVQAIALMLANRSKDKKKKTNLIVAPVAVLRVWQGEIETKIKKEAKFTSFIYGSGNAKTWKEIAKYDVVLVSYQTLANELKKHWPAKLSDDQKQLAVVPQISAMNSLKESNEYWSPFYYNESTFYRVILDEGQNIKNKNTKAAKACCTVDADYRWILSGTPIQNNMNELYSLIRFLRIPPYHREERFNADIGRPFGNNKRVEYDLEDRKRAIKKVQVLLRAIMLRRNKTDKIDGRPLLELPPKNVNVEQAMLTGDELEFYEELESKNKKLAKKLLDRKVKGAYSSVLTLLLRLRQACCHSELVVIGENNINNTKVANGKNFHNDWLRLYNVIKRVTQNAQDSVLNNLDSMTCVWCLEQLELESTVVLSGCGHLLCDACVEPFLDQASASASNHARSGGNGSTYVPCNECNKLTNDKEIVSYRLYDQVINQNFTTAQLYEEYEKEMERQKLNRRNGYVPDFTKLEPSTKMVQCFDVIKKVFDNSESEKIIIFSQFTTFFELFEHFLKREMDVPYLKYVGSMNAHQRSEVINEFYRNKNTRILLISMKAGNSGLTLTCANHVVIVDPFWNPYVEEQAQDRVYRISQTREVHVHKLFIKNSVEDRIEELQNRKRAMVDAAMDPSKIKEINRLGARELGFLFGLNSL
ncbi:hypothetical protein KAFR_0G02340 [Kazachstania africana CBS 2517]|uniref:RING-type domain-containing protein n=1 Tax=Kazachstania africana (strain ATCC 22294 / BCRC 22015 / CBS 2517 / CECT 1963 / NBRC 1671 / NRRL Y-8276) TaxID=1071382 RepID=H2AY18_KAZAF|nr:hypothetical protein KAFR_0G02340 [Kazachstania africana CBS 2517]CCF59268.1 hypothetical protein KAFR_0G02340 [Kazachstania africana CBS 2517]